MRRLTLLVGFALLAHTALLSAQGFDVFGKLFEKLTSVSVFPLRGWVDHAGEPIQGRGVLNGIGFELGFDLQTFFVHDTAKAASDGMDRISITLGIGYSQLGSLRGVDSFDIRGSLRQLPAVAVYGTYYTAKHPYILPYLGMSAGLASINRLRAYNDTNTAISATGDAETFQASLAAGFLLRPFRTGSVELFFEGLYAWREFSSITWSPVATPDSTNGFARLPRQANLSTWEVAVGVFVPIKAPTK